MRANSLHRRTLGQVEQFNAVIVDVLLRQIISHLSPLPNWSRVTGLSRQRQRIAGGFGAAGRALCTRGFVLNLAGATGFGRPSRLFGKHFVFAASGIGGTAWCAVSF